MLCSPLVILLTPCLVGASLARITRHTLINCCTSPGHTPRAIGHPHLVNTIHREVTTPQHTLPCSRRTANCSPKSGSGAQSGHDDKPFLVRRLGGAVGEIDGAGRFAASTSRRATRRTTQTVPASQAHDGRAVYGAYRLPPALVQPGIRAVIPPDGQAACAAVAAGTANSSRSPVGARVRRNNFRRAGADSGAATWPQPAAFPGVRPPRHPTPCLHHAPAPHQCQGHGAAATDTDPTPGPACQRASRRKPAPKLLRSAPAAKSPAVPAPPGADHRHMSTQT